GGRLSFSSSTSVPSGCKVPWTSTLFVLMSAPLLVVAPAPTHPGPFSLLLRRLQIGVDLLPRAVELLRSAGGAARRNRCRNASGVRCRDSVPVGRSWRAPCRQIRAARTPDRGPVRVLPSEPLPSSPLTSYPAGARRGRGLRGDGDALPQ